MATGLLVRQRRVWEIPQKLPTESGQRNRRGFDAAVTVTGCNAGERARRTERNGGQAMFTPAIWCSVALGTLFLSCSGYSQELNRVAHQFLQRHGVPCLFVVKVGSTNGLDEVTTCQDGREWALFWIEDEIAYVHPQTREFYKWDSEVYIAYPELYGGSKRAAYAELAAGDGP
jgi:hypothetical protein